jgi:hypothetical protein
MVGELGRADASTSIANLNNRVTDAFAAHVESEE